MRLHNQKGMTLVELLAVLVLTSIVIAATLQFFSVNLQSMNHQKTRVELQREATVMLSALQKQLYGAKMITISDTDPQTLTICQTNNTAVTFSLVDQQLQLENNFIANNLRNWQLKTPEANVLEVQLNLASPNGRYDVNLAETTMFRLRNYEEGTTCPPNES